MNKDVQSKGPASQATADKATMNKGCGEDCGCAKPHQAEAQKGKPKEIGGRNGPEPTRYGDWEMAGKCVDF